MKYYHESQKILQNKQRNVTKTNQLINKQTSASKTKKICRKKKFQIIFFKQEVQDEPKNQNVKQVEDIHQHQTNNVISKNQIQINKKKQHIQSQKMSLEIQDQNTFRIFQSMQSIKRFFQLQFEDEKQKEHSQKSQFICQVCQRSLQKKLQVRTFQCQHVFCVQCTYIYLLNKLENFQQIVCLQQSCKSLLNENSLFYQSLQEQIKKIYNKNKLRHIVLKDQNLKLCPTLNCQGILNLKLDNLKNCFCINCKKWICKSCFLQQHEGSCEQHKVNHLQNVFSYRQCSNCKIIVQKTQACDHITCKCKHQFCYRCGKTWHLDHECQGRRRNIQYNPYINRLPDQQQMAIILRNRQRQRINQTIIRYDSQFQRIEQVRGRLSGFQQQRNRRSQQYQVRENFLICCLCCCVINCYLLFIIGLCLQPIVISIILVLILVITFSSGALFFLIGILVGPVKYFKQLFCQQSVWQQIVSIMFLPLTIVIGSIKGVIYMQKTGMKTILQIDNKLLELILRTIKFFWQFIQKCICCCNNKQ